MPRNNFNQLKQSAVLLRNILLASSSSAAKEFLVGELGTLLEKIISSEHFALLADVPAFELMTRGILPEAEEAYFNFYSFACFDRPAHKGD